MSHQSKDFGNVMSQGKGRVRPLGSLRHLGSAAGSENIPKMPVQTKSQTFTGIHGNAMTVPPQKEKVEKEKKDVKPKSNSARSDSSAKSHDLVDRKELLEAKAREKELLKQISSLQKLVEELKVKIEEKEGKITELTEKLTKQEAGFKELIEDAKVQNEKMRDSLKQTENELKNTKQEIAKLEKQYEDKLNALRAELEKKISDITAEKDKEIAIRDEKLGRLKNQMADALKGNSWERQQQLEELTKELSRLQEESDTLRMKLKSISKSKGNCPNCHESHSKVDKLQTTMKEKDHTIKELTTLVAKFEKQLTQQDVLLKQWADSKGHKVNYIPK